MISDGEVLEALYRSRAHLTGATDFEFGDWETCTCGHIYAGTNGRVASSGTRVLYPRVGRYEEVIAATARALGWKGSVEVYPRDSPVIYVSDMTTAIARKRPEAQTAIEVGLEYDVEREDALAVIDEAIATIEQRQEADRLDVLAQARSVVDAVESERETVPA
jgi:hypothetical protein